MTYSVAFDERTGRYVVVDSRGRYWPQQFIYREQADDLAVALNRAKGQDE